MADACLYVGPDLASSATVTIPGIAETTERHRLPFDVPPLSANADIAGELARRSDLLGVIIGIDRGWVGSVHLRLASRVLGAGRRVWFHWPNEQAFECVDRAVIRSQWRHWAVIKFFFAAKTLRDALRAARSGTSLSDTLRGGVRQDRWVALEAAKDLLMRLSREVRPVPFAAIDAAASGDRHVGGTGAYLRLDYWVAITSGGSYGHTCYVAKELAASTDQLVCLMANRYPLLDEYGLRQVVLPRPSWQADDIDLPLATEHYYGLLKIALETTRPSYIYERLCVGNFAGAMLSLELGIPYIVEYNGSEISMRRSFDGTSFVNEGLLTLAEDVAFRQATLISVVSDVIKASLVARGVDSRKILVNPNGADPAVYRPPAPETRAALRQERGFADGDTVVGFSGTFGGWHGIDVLAAAIPRICAERPAVKFLLIGDGSHKAIVDAAVTQHGLSARVQTAGRVPQQEGARLLGACDLYVSPHNSHMVDSRFFGSPTKLFEYMAMGRGIVGSDLEQLGEVLSPALRAGDFNGVVPAVTRQRAVLCTPGDVDEFVAAVEALVDRPAVADALGANARQAVFDHYSWRRHVDRVWQFAIADHSAAAPAVGAGHRRLDTADAYKEEVQNQWNNNPVGTQYTKGSTPHTLEWFKEIEAYRYNEYGPWMLEVMEFDRHAGHDVLEIGGGVGTDLSQFARHGARVTDLDLSAGHLAHAQENFALRGLTGNFIHHDAEALPFADQSFDVVYSNGVLHHTPNTHHVISEIRRVLRPGGRAIIMMYAENSLHYWRQLVWNSGLRQNLLSRYSMGEIMSRHVEITANDARPLVKVYTGARLKTMFDGFDERVVYKRQLLVSELPDWLKFLPRTTAERWMGWNVIIKATKPRT